MYLYSWRAWTGMGPLPTVPFLRLPPLRAPASTALFALMLASLALCLGRVKPRLFCALHLASGALLILEDQLRFQPWAYQFMACALFLSFSDEEESLGLLRALTIGIYFYSGLSKLNWTFLHETGGFFAEGLLKPLGLNPAFLETAFPWLNLGLGLGEFALAPALFFKRSRPWALAAAAAMHLTILYFLSPWGQNWNRVVWPWNLYMIVQAWLLFTPGGEAAGRKAAAGPALSLCRAALTLMLALPLLKPLGLFDAYPAFTLYSDYAESSTIYLRWETGLRLPEALRRYLEPAAPDAYQRLWVGLKIVEWVEGELGVPPYPQQRYVAGLAQALCGSYDLGDGILVEHKGLPGVFSGAREALALEGCEQVCLDRGRFRLNAEPAQAPAPGASPLSACPPASDWSRRIAEGLAWLRKGRYDEAERSYEEAARLAEEAHSIDFRLARATDYLAALKLAQGGASAAAPFYAGSLALWEKVWGPRSPRLAEPLQRLASTLLRLRDLRGAQALYERALELNGQEDGPYGLAQRAQALSDLGLLLYAEKEPERAGPLLQEADRLYEGLLPDHPNRARALAALAAMSRAAGRDEEGAGLEAGARRIWAAHVKKVKQARAAAGPSP